MKTTPCGNSLIRILLIFKVCKDAVYFTMCPWFVSPMTYLSLVPKALSSVLWILLRYLFCFQKRYFFHLILFKYTPSIIVHFLILFLMLLKTILFSVAPTRIFPCSDKLTNCDEYPPDVCTNENYRLLRKEYCRKSLEYVQVSDTWLWT